MSETVLTTINQAIFGYVLMAIIAALCAGIIRLIVIVLARTQKEPPVVAPPLTVSVQPAADDPATIAAVIGAAVHATLGAPHRIVSFAEHQPPTANWAREMRSRHHTSHTPRR